MTRFVVYLLAFCLVSSFSIFAQDQKIDPKTYVFTDLKDVDEDYAYQGEYVGSIDGEKTGLQVITKGGGNFEGLLLLGGLPGAGWNGESQWRMSGKRADDNLTFSRDSYRDVDATKEKIAITYHVDSKSVQV
ncbi:MAG: hypothetical protein HON04_07735, partial [Planctomicrobium sp.]|nr:hypothetical protein [Planctomicrobium sp.]